MFLMSSQHTLRNNLNIVNTNNGQNVTLEPAEQTGHVTCKTVDITRAAQGVTADDFSEMEFRGISFCREVY